MTQNLNHYEKILSRSHSNYLAQISIEMTDANNQINDVLSKLTALGTVLIPMNLVTGTQAFLQAATVFDFLIRSVGYERPRTGARCCRKSYLLGEIVLLSNHRPSGSRLVYLHHCLSGCFRSYRRVCLCICFSHLAPVNCCRQVLHLQISGPTMKTIFIYS
jgi:hypothetical protein